jgi:hypothetical protein
MSRRLSCISAGDRNKAIDYRRSIDVLKIIATNQCTNETLVVVSASYHTPQRSTSSDLGSVLHPSIGLGLSKFPRVRNGRYDNQRLLRRPALQDRSGHPEPTNSPVGVVQRQRRPHGQLWITPSTTSTKRRNTTPQARACSLGQLWRSYWTKFTMPTRSMGRFKC